MATNDMRPIYPGEILREEFLVPLDLSANALVLALKVPAPRIWLRWLRPVGFSRSTIRMINLKCF